MKYITSILILSLIAQSQFVLAQAKNVIPSKKVRIEVHTFNQKKLKGHLRAVSDSVLVVYLVKSKTTEEFNYRNLLKVRVNKNRAKLIGFSAGIAAGVLIDVVIISSGFGADNEIPVGPVLTIFSIPIASGVTGAILAKKRITYKVDGNFDNFSVFKEKIK